MTSTRRPAVPAPGLALIVLAVMVALYLVDQFLARQEHAELNQEARNRYSEGVALLHAGKAHAAVGKFQRAHFLERSNIEYELALGEAQMADSDLDAARVTVTAALDANSNGGPANLLMARILAKEQRVPEADAFYHRAIYGAWPVAVQTSLSLRPPARARLELAQLLARQKARPELLSELLLLQNEANSDPETLRTIAGLFVDAGSPVRATAIYRELIRQNPGNIQAYAELGRAEILSGNYRAASAAFFDAVRRSPYDPQLGAELHMVSSLAVLDPTSRRLSSADKLKRSTQVLQMVLEQSTACLQTGKPPVNLQGLLDTARRLQTEKLTGPASNEASEARLEMAVKLWEARGQTCESPGAPQDPLPVLMKKLTQ